MNNVAVQGKFSTLQTRKEGRRKTEVKKRKVGSETSPAIKGIVLKKGT
jgi:hypothetical protein